MQAREAVRDHLIKVVDESANALHMKVPITTADVNEIYAKIRFRANSLGDADSVLDAQYILEFSWFGHLRTKKFDTLMAGLQYKVETFLKQRSIGNAVKAQWYEIALWPGVDVLSLRAQD